MAANWSICTLADAYLTKNQKEENQRRGTKKKKKPPASIEGKLILAGGKLKAGRSLEVVGDAEGGGEDTVV